LAQAPVASDVTVGLKAGIWHLNVLAIRLQDKPITAMSFRDTGTPASRSWWG